MIIIVTSHKKNEWDGGDSVITEGLMNIFPELRQCELVFSEDIPYEETDNFVSRSNYIIHAGTPSWVANRNRRFWISAIKYQKHISMLGIGLAVPYNSEMWYGSEDFVSLKDSGLIDLIICRDKYCYYWLHQRLGFPSGKILLLPCPGLFMAEEGVCSSSKKNVILSIANITETAHESKYTFESYYEKTAHLANDLERSGANVSVVYQRFLNPCFQDICKIHFKDRPIASFSSRKQFNDFIHKNDVYIGVRNHGAIPCSGAAKPSLLLGTDYRQSIIDELPFIGKIDISHTKWNVSLVMNWYHALEPTGISRSLINFRRIAVDRWRDAIGTILNKIGLTNKTYPYVEKHKVWGNEFDFTINSLRTENWYGLLGADSDGFKAFNKINNWNIFLKGMIKEGDTVIDCGANEGHTTIVFAKQVGKNGKVVAIDADINNINLIKKNLSLNNITNVEVIHAIIDEKSGGAKFFEHEVVQNEQTGTKVRTVKLDDFAYLNPDFIKVDIEGYELPALRGAKEILKNGVKLEVEMHVSKTTGINMKDRFGFDPHELINLLKNNGYKIYFDHRELQEGEIPEGCIRAIVH